MVGNKSTHQLSKNSQWNQIYQELLVQSGISSGSTKELAIGDLTTIAFYYLLRVGEYATKSTRAITKRTVQFKSEDITFFKRNASKQLVCLPRSAHTNDILSADGATLKLDNQKNGYKGVCIYQEANGDNTHCPVRALGRRFVHIRQHEGVMRRHLYAHTGTKESNTTLRQRQRTLVAA
jgi:hypothetical protein